MVETATTIEYTPEELRAELERQALARRDMSLDDLVCAYDEGQLEDAGDVADLLALADLLPEPQAHT